MTTENGYAQLFGNYIVAGVEASLARVRAADGLLTDADRQQAWHMLSYALAVDEAWSGVRDLLLALTPKMIQAGHWREWVPYLEQGLVQSQSQQDIDAEAELSFYLGYLQQRLGHLDAADAYAGAAVEIFMQRDNQRRLGAALNRHAEVKRSRRDFVAAERLTDAALSQLNVADEANREERGHAYLIKGRVAFDQRRWSLAGQHFEHALRLYEETDDLRRIAVCTQNLGRVRSMEEDYDGAIIAYRRAIGLLKRSNERFNLAAAQMNLGIAYSLSGKPEAALAAYAEAEPIFRRLQDRAHLARLFNNQGMEMNNLQRWDDAKELLQASSGFCLELDNLQWYLSAQDMLGLAYMGSEDFDSAITIYERALALSVTEAGRGFAERTLTNLTNHLRKAQQACETHPQTS